AGQGVFQLAVEIALACGDAAGRNAGAPFCRGVRDRAGDLGMAVEAEIVAGGEVHHLVAVDDAARACADIVGAVEREAQAERIGQGALAAQMLVGRNALERHVATALADGRGLVGFLGRRRAAHGVQQGGLCAAGQPGALHVGAHTRATATSLCLAAVLSAIISAARAASAMPCCCIRRRSASSCGWWPERRPAISRAATSLTLTPALMATTGNSMPKRFSMLMRKSRLIMESSPSSSSGRVISMSSGGRRKMRATSAASRAATRARASPSLLPAIRAARSISMGAMPSPPAN